MNMVTKAAKFAVYCHGDQQYGKFPYFYHLAMAVQKAIEHGLQNDEVIAAIWLHDTIEDTDLKYEEVSSSYTEYVADLVIAVSKPKDLSRKEGNSITNQRILDFPDSSIVKLADRIANISHCKSLNNESMIKMYCQEHEVFGKVMTEAVAKIEDKDLRKVGERMLLTIKEKYV